MYTDIHETVKQHARIVCILVFVSTALGVSSVFFSSWRNAEIIGPSFVSEVEYGVLQWCATSNHTGAFVQDCGRITTDCNVLFENESESLQWDCRLFNVFRSLVWASISCITISLVLSISTSFGCTKHCTFWNTVFLFLTRKLKFHLPLSYSYCLCAFCFTFPLYYPALSVQDLPSHLLFLPLRPSFAPLPTVLTGAGCLGVFMFFTSECDDVKGSAPGDHEFSCENGISFYFSIGAVVASFLALLLSLSDLCFLEKNLSRSVDSAPRGPHFSDDEDEDDEYSALSRSTTRRMKPSRTHSARQWEAAMIGARSANEVDAQPQLEMVMEPSQAEEVNEEDYDNLLNRYRVDKPQFEPQPGDQI